MSFTTVPTVNNGDSWSAAQHNTYIRDNFAAVWPFTTAGDLAYASASNALARLALGSAYKFLQSNGSAPAWGGLQFASVYHSTTQNVGTGSPTALVFNTEEVDNDNWHSTVSNTSRITVSSSGYYIASAFIQYSTGGGSGTYLDTITLKRSGIDLFYDRRYQEVSALAKIFSVTFPIVGVSAGGYLEIFLEQNSGQTATVAASTRFSVWRLPS